MQSAKTMQISVTDSVKFVQINVMDSVKFMQINVTDSVKFMQINVMDSSRSRADQRDGSSEIRVEQHDGFSQNSRRKTCTHAVSVVSSHNDVRRKRVTKSTSRRNRFFALTAIESDDDEEVNAIETVQEVVEITVDSGAAMSVWPSRKKCGENEIEESGELGSGERKSNLS